MNLKKLLVVSLIPCTIFMAGCDNDKDYTYDEAFAKASETSEILQSFILEENNYSSTFKADVDVNGDANVSFAFNGNVEENKEKESSTTINFDVKGDEIPHVDGTFKTLNNKDALYFILENLNVQGDDQTAGAIDMMIAGFKNQWFKLDLNQLLAQEGMQNFDFKGITEDYIENYYKALKNMDMKALYKELGNNPYEGVFTGYNGKKAYQFTMDDAKFAEFMNVFVNATVDYYTKLQNQLGEEAGFDEAIEVVKSLKIDPFTGNFVIDGENVITVIDQMNFSMDGVTFTISTHNGDDGLYAAISVNGEMNIFDENGNRVSEPMNQENMMVINAVKKSRDTYATTLTLNFDGQTITLSGDVKFTIDNDKIAVKVSVPYQIDENNSINVNFEVTSKKVSSVSITFPEDTKDFLELMGMFGGMFGMGDMSAMDYNTEDSMVAPIEE